MSDVLPYASSLEHLLAEVNRLELLLGARAYAHRAAEPAHRSISADERISALLDKSSTSDAKPSAAMQAVHTTANRLAGQIELRKSASLRAGMSLRLVQLAERFELKRIDLDLLLGALVPEIPGNIGGRENRISVGDLLSALFPSREEQIEARRHVHDQALLLRHGLLILGGDKAAPLLTRTATVDPRVVGFLLHDDSIDDVARLQSKSIGMLARPVTSAYQWSDLVLPADKLAILHEICGQARHREQVLDAWGYERKLGLRKGVSALFSGPPGTGKTMAAGVVARELGVPLLHIDLSTVVSKYIGETEKHLAQLFDGAEAAHAALFFDEADALFGKRTDVRDSHDRYANLETSYLLQRIESYGGVVLCATNFMKNIDEAFVRRFGFIVEFPFPSAADRQRMWRNMWTPETPLDPDVDERLLAERIELSGGYLRNIALAAAFLAADEGKPIAMRHLLHATRREFQKIGKVVDAGFFESRR